MALNISTTRTKCFSTTMMAFPFIIIFLLLSYSCVCIAEEERIKESNDDAARIRRQLTDRHGNFLGRQSSTLIERSSSLGRNMPVDIDHHILEDNNYGERIKGERTERQLGNRKVWLDRYKEMLNRWEKNDDQKVSNSNDHNVYDSNPSTPNVRETYVIPDTNSVSFLISGGDKYSSGGNRKRASLAQTLSDHKVIEGIQRLMTSTTQSTTRKLYRTTYLSPIRTRYTTQTFRKTTVPTTTVRTTRTTTTSSRTTSRSTQRPQLYTQGKGQLIYHRNMHIKIKNYRVCGCSYILLLFFFSN